MAEANREINTGIFIMRTKINCLYSLAKSLNKSCDFQILKRMERQNFNNDTKKTTRYTLQYSYIVAILKRCTETV